MEGKDVGKRITIGFQSKNGIHKWIHGDTVDELIDAFESLKDGEFIAKFVEEFSNLTEEELKRLDKIVLTTDDAKQISKYALMRREIKDLAAFEDKLIELKNPTVIREFTGYVKGVNAFKMTEGMVQSKDAYQTLRFYKETKDADSKKIKQAIFELQDSGYIYKFFVTKMNKGEEITQDDISEAEKIIIDSKEDDDDKMRTIISWAADIKGANISLLEDVIVESKIPTKIRLFAEKVTGADIKRLENEIIESNDAANMYYFATGVKDADVDRLIKAIKETNDKNYIDKCKWAFGKMKVFFA